MIKRFRRSRLNRVSQDTTTPVPRDERTIKTILEAAAKSMGSTEDIEGIAAALEKQGVRFAWQLALLTPEHFRRVDGISLGLETAIQDVIANPTTESAPAKDIELTPALRQFLLLPAADGTPPRRMRALSAMFYSTMLLPIAERQEMCLVACELLSLVSGLFLTIPISFMDFRTMKDAPKGWNVWPDYEDGMSMCSLAIFMSILTATVNSVIMAIFVALVGRSGSNTFYERTFTGLACTTAIFMIGNFLTLGMVVWQTFTVSRSPYLVIFWILIGYQALSYLTAIMARGIIIGAPLELYHWPRWVFMVLIMMCPPVMKDDQGRKLVDKKVIRAMAEARAKELRVQLGVE